MPNKPFPSIRGSRSSRRLPLSAKVWKQRYLIFMSAPFVVQYLAIACSAAPEEFDGIWDEFMNKLDVLGVDQLGVYATEILKDNFFVVWEEDEDEDDEDDEDEFDGEQDLEEEEDGEEEE